ncbi:TolC family protein [Sulfurimicrobium lacus]|nr:TolC family protein [Sulfurimicrobium lacus]
MKKPCHFSLAAACLLGAMVFPAQAEQFDPFSTQGLVADSPASSVGRNILNSPCPDAHSYPAALSLTDVVERALCNNPQTREAWANARFQAAQVGVGQSAYLPGVSVAASASRNRNSGGTATPSYNQQNLNASLSYLLYDFGARDAALENARQVLAALNATQDATIQTVFLAGVQAYYQLFATRAAVNSALEAEKSALASLDAATARYEVGSGTPADKLQAQTAYSQAVLNRIQAEGDARNAQGVLANTMGADADRAFQIVPPSLQIPDAQFGRDIAKLIEQARRQRPDLAAAQAQVEAARANVEAARAAGMPTITLGASAGRSDTSISDPSNTSSVGVSINFPLFTGYNTTYRVRAAREQVDVRLAQRERTSQQIALDVWKAYQSVVTGNQAVKTSADLVASAAHSEQVALGRFKAGVGSILDLLTAQSALAGARLQNIQAVYNWHIAKASLAQSMGSLDFSALAASAPQQTNP